MKTLLPILALTALVACGRNRYDSRERERESQHYRESIDGKGAKEVKAIVHMSAGELRIAGGAAGKLLEADIQTSGDRPKVRYDDGSRGRLEISEEGTNFHLGNTKNDWDLRLSEKTPIDLEVHLGAGEARIDLSDVILHSLVIHMGAGELDLDLRGDYPSDVDIEIHGGVGEAKLKLPRHANIDAEVHGGLGDVSAHGLEQHDDRYVNRGSAGARRMTLQIHGGIGHIDLDAN